MLRPIIASRSKRELSFKALIAFTKREGTAATYRDSTDRRLNRPDADRREAGVSAALSGWIYDPHQHRFVLPKGQTHATQASFIQDDDMVRALAANRADQVLDIGILPRRLRSREEFANVQPPCRFVEFYS